ncbi:MAG: PAS domain S-box protein, partial [Chloroflexota bacterium]
ELSLVVEELQTAEEELRIQDERLATSELLAVQQWHRYQELFQCAPDPYLVTDENGTIQEANWAAARRLGLQAVFLVGKPLATFILPEDRREFRTLIATHGEGPRPTACEVRFQSRDGHTFVGQVSLDRTHDTETEADLFRWMIRDVTESKRLTGELQSFNSELERRVAKRTAELELAFHRQDELLRQSQAAEERYRSLFTSASDAVILVNARGIIQDANPAAAALLALSIDGLSGMSADEILSTPSEILGHGSEETWRKEIEVRRSDGRNVPVDASATVVHLPDEVVTLIALRDISERRALAQLQDEFLAMAAHELKTPLTSIKGFAQLLQRGGSSSERAARVIVSQVDHLDQLIGDLLDVTRLESSQIRIEPAEVDLLEIITQAATKAQSLTSTQVIECQIPGRSIVGSWDAYRIDQVLANLLSNAVKYAPKSQRIVVECVDLDDEVCVSVTDFGPGIDTVALPKLFSRFYRIDNPTRRGVAGLGVGLYINRLTVQAHGGKMNVRSSPGKGSTFSFTLPKSDSAEPRPSASGS